MAARVSERAGPSAVSGSPSAGYGASAATCAVLLLLTIPRFASGRLLSVGALGLASDVSVGQLVCLGLGGAAFLLHGRRMTKTGTLVLTAASIVVVTNLGHVILGSHADVTTLARGAFTTIVNAAPIVFLARYLQDRSDVRAVARGVVWYLAALIGSGLVEFFLVTVAPVFLPVWRRLVWGPVPPTELQVLGGVVLHAGAGAAIRVGGFAGAPENLGLYLALGLPALVLADVRERAANLVLGGAALLTIVTASRSLLLGLVLFTVLFLLSRRGTVTRARVGVAAAIVVFGGLLWFSQANPYAGARLDQQVRDAELTRRTAEAHALLRDSALGGWSLATGTGMGWSGSADPRFAAIASGLLGGDYVVAWVTGGLVACVVVGLLALALIRACLRWRRRPRGAAVAWYPLIFVFALSFAQIVFTQLYLIQSLVLVLVFGIAVCMDADALADEQLPGSLAEAARD